MAYQHFYSRVPARLSMFERADSFDTFAKSEQFDEKYINSNFIPFCNIKLTQNELNQIRDGKFTTAYAQYFSKNGENLIHSAISYIPLDFTGERSSYMVHSLQYTDEERIKITTSTRNGLINRKLFNTDINSFDITSKDAKPIEDIEDIEVTGEKSGQLEQFATRFAPIVVKRLMFAMLNSLSSKGKPIYITLNVDISKLSEEALNFMNTLIQVFPFHVRNKLSFITFLTDANRYNFIKIKFMPRDCMTVNLAKAHQFDMTTKTIDGIRDEEYKAKETEMDFLYELISNKQLRDKFLSFYDNIIEVNPKLANFDMKDFSNIVFLFRQSCGAYDEKFVTPEDKDVLALLTVYEQYREYLKEKDRCEILKCIQRYATKRIIIPQNVFQKVSKLYPNELVKCKTTVMAIILELIHTDVMREKLFTFIKNNYGKEIPKNRSIISEDLSRVFYGGFLQTQILGLFSANFETEANSTRTTILEKLLLAIRTKEVQDKILDFLSKFYELYTPSQKEMVYKTFYEMLPENDDLTKKIVTFINNHYDKDSHNYQKKVISNVTTLVEADEKKKNKQLLEIILSIPGFLENAMFGNAFTIWSNKGTFTRFLQSFEEMNSSEVCDSLIKAWTYGYEMTPQTEKKLYEKTIEVLSSMRGLKLYNITDFNDKLLNITTDDFIKLNEIPEESVERIKAFVEKVQNGFICNFINNHLLDGLNPKLREDGIEFVLNYSKKVNFVEGHENYYYVLIAYNTINAIKEKNYEIALNQVVNDEFNKPTSQAILNALKFHLEQTEKDAYAHLESFDQAMCISGIYSYLETLSSHLIDVYNYSYGKRKEFLLANRYAIENKKSDINFDALASIWTFEYVLKYANLLEKVLEKNEQKEEIFSKEYGIIKVVNVALEKFDKDGNKKLQSIVDLIKENNKLYEVVNKAIEDYRKENKTGFFAKLFKKNKKSEE